MKSKITFRICTLQDLEKGSFSQKERKFYQGIYPCGICGKAIKVANVFFHHRSYHANIHYYDSERLPRCSLCGDRLAQIVTGNKGWQKRLNHYCREHRKNLIEGLRMVRVDIEI